MHYESAGNTSSREESSQNVSLIQRVITITKDGEEGREKSFSSTYLNHTSQISLLSPPPPTHTVPHTQQTPNSLTHNSPFQTHHFQP
ncbi:unnamed protein product [Periconia digitata]|uniref:Uncharacterized protein n=1 Tax=Periconia digitata TaxID=1303443 RepID=A0A9W4XWX1_9PLEO|nr:unnamed protein product [Periconia digitata]